MNAIFVNTHGEQQNKQTTQTCYKLVTNISLKKPKEMVFQTCTFILRGKI